jgi:hypothetical protein
MIWAQVVGIFGLAVLLLIFQFNDRRIILRLQALSGLIWALQYILLGAYTGAVMNFLMSVRNYLFEKYGHKTYVFWVSLAAIVGSGLMTWADWSSVLPTVASVIATVAVWQKRPRRIRFMMLVVPPLWFAYNVIHGSYPGMIGDTITFCSLLIGIYRFDIRKKQGATVPVR